MKPEEIKRLKELAVTAIFADDYLFDRLVFKGGNALSLIYGISERASFDLDFSIPGQFAADEMPGIEAQLKQTLESQFRQAGYEVFDFELTEKPHKISEAVKDFWGGYAVAFKIIELKKYQQHKSNLDQLRRNAVAIGKRGSTKIDIDISKYEICDGKQEEELNGYPIYVYSPAMLVLEKLRAICQQTKAYQQVISTHNPRPRARDFYDIYLLMNHSQIDPHSEANQHLMKRIFDAKRARLCVSELEASKELHRADFVSLKDTLPSQAAAALRDFDFYFDFVLQHFGHLEALWNE